MFNEDLAQLMLFQDFNAEQLEMLRPLFTYFYMPADSVVFDQGEMAEFFYILVEGEVAIRYKPDDGPLLVVTRVHPEAVIGWSAAIGSPLYTSSAVCTSECKILRVQGEKLREFYQTHPGTGGMFLERLATMIERRLRSNHPQLMALLEQGMSIRLDKLAPAV